MENALAIAAVSGPLYLMVGLSILLYGKSWQKIMGDWNKNHLAVFGLMFLQGVLGLIIIRMYNVWEWNIWLLVTISGWAMFVKCVFYFLAPGYVIKSLFKLANSKVLLYIGGLAALIIGAALSYYVYFV